MHGEGSNGGTTFTDSSPAARSMTRSGALTEISTAQFKYGAASISCPGTANTDYLAASAASSGFDFGSGDFTVEAWIRPTAVSSLRFVLSNRQTVADNGWFLGTNSSGLLAFQCWNGGGSVISVTGGSVSAGAWQHVAVSRIGNSFRIFVDGSETASGSSAAAIGNSTQALRSHDPTTSGRQFQGYIDEIRITKGVGRYAAGFTPPTAQFPDS